MNKTALQHKISDANHVRVDVDVQGNSVLEIEFRFVRYRLTIDDKQKAEKLLTVLRQILSKDDKEVEAPAMPKFYRKGKKHAP